MDRMKRITALLIALGIALTSTISAFAAANFDDDGNRDNNNGLSEEEQNVAIKDTHPQHELDNPEDAYMEKLEYDEYIKGRNEYNEVIKKLSAFGMWHTLPDGSYLQPIKAGEFFLAMCRYINFDNFIDENTDDAELYKTAYETLNSLGYADFEIDLNGTISFDQAVRILTNALGYKSFADFRGGTADAYMQVASEHKIARRFPKNRNDALTRTAAAELIENSTEAKVYIINGTEGYSYENVLDYYKDIYEINDVVTSVSDNAISDGKTIKNGIRVGNYLLESDRKDLYDYLACKVKVFYRQEESGGRTLLYITNHITNSIVTVEGCNIESYENERISYYVNGTAKKKLVLDSKAKEILNGFAPKAVNGEDMENCDYIKLVDNNNDGKYDVVFVYKYDIMVVERVSESHDMIYGLYNDNEKGALTVDFDSNTLEMTDRMGNPVDVYYITKDSVLSVANDPQSSRQKIIVSNLMYTGTVKSTEIGESYHDSTVYFEDRSYTYSTNFKYYRGSKALKNGSRYNVYLDYRGRIAGYDLIKDDEIKYGILIKGWIDTDNGGDDTVVKLYPYSGDMANFMLAKRTRIDGDVCKTAADKISMLNKAAEYQSIKLRSLDDKYVPMNFQTGDIVFPRVPIMYKQNDAGEITYIDTPFHGYNENPENNDVFHDNSMTMYDDFSKREGTTKKPGGMFLRNTLAFNSDNGNNIAMTTATKVFVVPISNDPSELTDVKNYQKTNLSYFTDWNYYPKSGTQYPVENRIEAYNVNEARVAEVVVYYTSDTVPEIDKKVPLTVVEKVIDAVNNEGDVVKRLVGYQGNAEIEVDLAEGVWLTRYYNGENGEKIKSEVKRGDIIRYVTNNSGELVDYVKVFSLRDEDDPDYVKTGNEYGTTVDPSTLNKTMLAVSDGKYTKNGHNTAHIYTELGNYNYGANYRLVYGTLLYKNGSNMVLKTKVDTALGQREIIELADFSGFNVIMIDETRDMIYVPNENELLAEQGAGEDASRVILHTEGGKQKQLIIVKRSK
ncbi:MAG: hypothetical protein SOS24_04745 [Clostridia bacterium]|nr:hypothetical protein [Clostridia bacterium]